MLYSRRTLKRKIQMAALDAAQVEALQNSTPTDFATLDQQLRDRSNWDTNRFAGDDRLHVKFFSKAYRNDEKSLAANRPIWEDKDCIQIMVPGDKHNIIIRPVWDQDIQRWPTKWAQYKAGQEQGQSGTPLKFAPFISEGMAEELAYMNIRTIEQLANLSDGNMPFMGAADFKRQAQQYLAKSTSTDALLERLAAMEAELATLKGQPKEAPQDPTKGRTRSLREQVAEV
jgi:hypothetical protein